MKHLIKKHIFDIRMGNERKAPAIQDRISEVFRQKLTTVIEEIFNRFSNPNQLIRIDKLELDLGEIGELYLEDELIRKISYQLPFALSEIIAKAELTSHKEGVEITSTTHSNLELLQFYLQNGALPWWHKSDSQSESIETIFQQLLTQKPRATATLLQKIGKQKTVQKRLMFQFSNELLEKVIRLLIPKYALSVNTYINKIQQQIQRQKLQNNITQTALKHQIYTFTLQYIFESDTLFTLTPFKTALKENLTAHFEFKSEESDALFEGLTEDTKTPNATQNLQSQFEILRYFLKEGRLPDWSYIHSKDSLEDVLSHLLDREPQRLLRFFRLINNPHQISQRIVYQFSKETVARLFDLLTHQQASFVHDYLHNLNKIYGFRSGQKPRMEENLKISIFSFFLQKNASFTPTSFNKHVSSQLLQKRIIAEKEVAEVFDLVTARTTNDKQQVETFYQNVSTNTQAPKHPNTTTNPNTQTQVSTQTPKHTSTLIETIEFFLENGRIPSNLQENLKDLSFNQLFTKFLQEQSINLSSLLHQTFAHENRQKRLIQQLSEELLGQIIQILQPDFALQIQDFKERILQYDPKNSEQSTSQTQYQYHQRSAILRYLLTTTNAVFDLADFEKEMTKRLQQEFGDSEESTQEKRQSTDKEQNTYRRFTKTSLQTPEHDYQPQHSNTKENTLVETIAYFLQYARLPKQIESQWQGLSFEELFVKLLDKQAQKVLPLLQNAAKTAEAQERLILQLSETTLTQLLQILQPKYATFLQNFRSILQELHSKEPQLFKTTNDPKILQWQYILAHLFTIQSIAFHPTTFIAKAIQYLATEGNKSRKNFVIALQKLIQQQEKTSTQKNENLQNITAALASAIELQKQRQQTPTATQTPPKHPNLTQSITYFLLNQKLPSKTSPNIAGLSFEELMLQLLKEEPRQIPKLLQTTAKNKNEQNTLIQYLSDATLTKLLEKLSSKTLYFAETLRQNLNKLQTLSPQIFTQESSPKKLQWQILIDYALQTPKPNFKEFSTQKITQLTTQNIKDRKEQAPTIETIKKITQQKTVRTYDLPQSIGYFLRYDRLPKQVKKDIQGLSFEQLFTQLLQKQSRQTLALLQQTAKEKTSQKRLIQHLSEKTLEEWVRTLHPNFEGFIATYRLSLQKLQQSKPQIFSRNPSPKMLQWQGIVAYLLNPSTTTSSSSFDTKTFTIQALQNIAPSSKEQRFTFMTELQRTVQQEMEAKQYRFYPLGEVLEGLVTNDLRLVTGEGEKKDEKPNTYRRFSKTSLPNTQTPKHNYQPNPPNTEQNPNTQTQLSTQTQPKTLTESIAYFLQHARLPQNIESEWQGLTFEQLFVKLLETQALKVLPFLRIAARTTEAQERLVFQLSEETLVLLVEVLQPQFATFIEEFRALTTRFYEKNGTLFQPINDLQVLQWQVILAYLLAPQTDEFYPTTFITKIIQRLSLKGKEAQQQFAETLQNFLLQQEKTIFYQVLSKHLSSAIALQSEAPPVAKKQPKKPLNIVQAIAYFLLNEKLTDHVQDSIKGLSFEGLIQKWIQEHPEKVSFFLQRTMEDNTQQSVLIQHLPNGMLVKMLEKVDTQVIRWVEKLRRVLNKLQGQMPHFFAAYKSPRFLQWQLLIAFVLQKTKIDFDSFLAQKMEELTVENTLQEKELILQSLQKVLQKTADSENFNLPQSIGFFLRYERLPQKMEVSIEGKNFEALFTQFLQKQPRQVAPFLQQVLKEREQQTRLIHQLPEEALRELVQTLQPNFAGFIETFRLAIQKLQQESKSIFQEDADGKELEWEGILTYLLEASTGEFDSKKFVVYSLRVILGQVKVSREVFLESLQEVVKVAIGKREMRFYPLGEVLDETVISDLRLGSGEETTNSLPRDLGGRRLTSDVLKQEFEGSEELIGDSLQMTDEEHDTYRRFSKTSLQTMEYFLKHGRLPERMETSITGKSFEELFDQFLREEPRKVVPFLKAKAQTGIKQKRLIRALSEAILKEMVVKWQPDFAGFVETFRLAVKKLQQRKRGALKGRKEGKVLQWEGILKYLLEASTGRFDTKDFTVRALQVIAPKGGLQKEEFLKSLKEVVQEGIDAKEYRFYPLGEVLENLVIGDLRWVTGEESTDDGRLIVDREQEIEVLKESMNEEKELNPQTQLSTQTPKHLNTKTESLIYFLEHGRLPERVEESIEGKSFGELFDQFLEEAPRKVVPFLKAKAKSSVNRERLIGALSEVTLKEMVVKWQPDFAGFVETFRLAIQKLQQRKRGVLKGSKEGKVLQWEGVLKYLLETSTERFDTKDFTVRALQVIAPKSGLQKEEFLKSLKEVVQEEIDAKEYRFYPLGEILGKLVIGDLRWVTDEETTDSLPRDLEGRRLTVDKEQEFGNLEESTDEEQDLNTQIQLPTQTQDPKTKRDKEEEEESRREWALEDLLVYFLEYGLLPKRMPRKWRNSTFEGLFVELLERSSKKTLPLLRKEVKANEAQERLIKQLSDKTLSQLLKVVLGANVAFVEKFMAVLRKLYAVDSSVFKVENNRMLQWRSVIAYLVEGDAGFDRLGFLAFAIRYLAKMSSRSAVELLAQIQAVVSQMEEADEVKVLKVSLQSLAKIAEVVFAVGREESDKEVIEQHSISTPMARELERIGLQLNEDDIFDMREVVNYLYGAKTQTAKYSKAKFERLFRELIETYPDTSKATLQTLLRDEDVLQKILKEFSDKTYQAIVALLQPSWAKRSEQYLKDLTVMFKAEVMRRELLWYLKDIDEFSFSLADFIHQVLNEVIDGDKEEYGRMLITTIQYLKMTELTSKNDLREALSELKVKYDVRVGNIKPKGQKRQTSLDEKAKTKKTLLEETIYVQNAGLVLIYPFLSRYFNFLGMLEENKFKDEATANRAVLLLQYLATGFSKSPEHELILNKLLCGLPLDTPVPSEIEMTDKEKEISGQMLQAIIQNWKRLNNMTVDNFRGSFILRDGKLEESEKFWQLKVEKKAWDVLLKTLPWGYTMVRLPWMEKIINVEWQA